VLLLILNVDAGEGLHLLVLDITFVLVTVKFLPKEYKPVFLEHASFLLFFENFTFEVQ